jgi:hypothetical protein
MSKNSDIFARYASTDYFFFYGERQLDVHDECASDFMQLIVQPQQSCYFMRNYGAGVESYLNNPIGLMMQIMIPFNISNSVAFRNTVVADGSDGYPDRRIATSQSAITIQTDQSGNVDISAYYYLFSDTSQQQNIKFSGAR